MVLRRFMPSFAVCLLGVVLLGSNGTAGEAPIKKTSTPMSDPGGPTADFAKDIEPILAKYCVNCHGSAKPKAGLSLAFKTLTEAGKKLQIWERVAAQLQAGEMPPSGRPQPTARKWNCSPIGSTTTCWAANVLASAIPAG